MEQLQPGQMLGPYRILNQIGQGGMATVYKAYHPRLDRHVAIKVLHPAFKEDESFLRRFTREAQVVARLEHPNIVPVYDFAEHKGHPYLVMRHIDGETLKDKLSQGSLSRKEIVRIAQAIADGLDYAHKKGVLHRDIKPSNILMTTGGGVFIADFGLARITQAGESTMSQDMIMGTPQYISPEQAKGIQDIDGRTDIYSFGIIVYEMTTGQVPFQSDTGYSIIHSQIFDPPPMPGSINDKISPQLEEVLLKVLSKEPEDRYASAGEFQIAFKRAVADVPSDISPAGAAVLPDSTEKITDVMPPVPEPVVEETIPEPVAATPVQESVAIAETPKKKKRPFWVFALAGLVGLCLCGFIFLGFLRTVAEEASDGFANTGATIEAITESEEFAKEMEDVGALFEDVEHPEPPLREPRPIADLEEMLAANPDDDQARLELAAAYIHDGDHDAAKELIRGNSPFTRNPGGILTVTNRLMENEEYDLAIFILEEGYAKFKNNDELQQTLMMAYILNDVRTERVVQYVSALVENNAASQVAIDLGEAYVAFNENGDDHLAFDILDNALENSDPKSESFIIFLTGYLEAENGLEDEAYDTLSSAKGLPAPPWLTTLIQQNIVELEG